MNGTSVSYKQTSLGRITVTYTVQSPLYVLELSMTKYLPLALVPADCSTFLAFPPAKDFFKSVSLFPDPGFSILGQDLALITLSQLGFSAEFCMLTRRHLGTKRAFLRAK